MKRQLQLAARQSHAESWPNTQGQTIQNHDTQDQITQGQNTQGKSIQGQTSKAKHSSLIVLFRLVVLFRLQHVHDSMQSFRLAVHLIDSGLIMRRAPDGNQPKRYPTSLNLDQVALAV
jgi:hypothetical protein